MKATLIDPRLTADGLYMVTHEGLPPVMDDHVLATALIVRGGELYGVRAAEIDDPIGLRNLLRHPKVTLKKVD